MISRASSILRSRTFERVPVNLGYADLPTVEVDGKRQYVIPSGETFPSITTVLSHGKSHFIENWKKRVGAQEAERVSRVACARGEGLHSLAERYVRNDSDFVKPTDMPDAVAMFRAILPRINTSVGRVYLQETPLYSTQLRVAGRTDLIAEFDGKIAVIDFKSSSRVKTRSQIKNYFMQEAGYATMFEERTGIRVDRLVTLMAVDGQSQPLVFVEERDQWIDSLKEAIHAYEQSKARGSEHRPDGARLE